MQSYRRDALNLRLIFIYLVVFMRYDSEVLKVRFIFEVYADRHIGAIAFVTLKVQEIELYNRTRLRKWIV